MSFESDLSFLNSDIDQYLSMFGDEGEQKDVIVGADNDSTFADLFPNINDCIAGDQNSLLSQPVDKSATKTPSRKGPTIYKIKLNSTNDLQRILNVANGFGNKSPKQENGIVSSSTKSENDKDHIGNRNCMSKNAVAARENRLKKKKYVETLESSVEKLVAENSDLRYNLNNLKGQVDSYSKEVQYLRTVLANVNEISALIKNVKSTPSVNLSTSLLESSTAEHSPTSKKRKIDESGNTNTKQMKVRSFDQNPGVCLHVVKDKVSLEFCYACSNNAKSSQSPGNDSNLEDHDYVDVSSD